MKTTNDILDAVIEDAQYYLKRNVPNMRIDPKIVLDLAMDAKRVAEFEAGTDRLDKWLKGNPQHWYGNEAPTGDTVGLVIAVLNSLADDREELKADCDVFTNQSRDDANLIADLRTCVEKVRELRDTLRDQYPDASMTSKAAVEKLTAALSIAGMEE